MNIFFIIFFITLSLVIFGFIIFLILCWLNCLKNRNSNDESIFSNKYLYPVSTEANIKEIATVEVKIIS